MSKTYRLGVIGFAHMHVNHLLDVFAAQPNVEGPAPTPSPTAPPPA